MPTCSATLQVGLHFTAGQAVSVTPDGAFAIFRGELVTPEGICGLDRQAPAVLYAL